MTEIGRKFYGNSEEGATTGQIPENFAKKVLLELGWKDEGRLGHRKSPKSRAQSGPRWVLREAALGGVRSGNRDENQRHQKHPGQEGGGQAVGHSARSTGQGGRSGQVFRLGAGPTPPPHCGFALAGGSASLSWSTQRVCAAHSGRADHCHCGLPLC